MRTLTVGLNEQSQLIEINPDQRYRHIYLVGKTGTGKTSLLLRFIQQDSFGEHAIVFFDIKGEEAEAALGLVDESRVVRYCSMEYPVAINPLRHPYKRRCTDDHDKHVVFDTLCEIINQAIASITGQVSLTGAMRDVLRPWVFKELDTKHPSLERMLRNILEDAKANPQHYRGDNAGAVYRLAVRLSEILSDDSFNRIISGARALNWNELLEKGHILIVNAHGMTPGQQFFLGNVITKGLTAYFMHTPKPTFGYPGCAMFLDEFEAFVNKDFLALMRRARSFNFSVVLAHQDHANIHGSPMFQRILHSMLSNAGTLAAFRIGAHESSILAREFTDKKLYDFKDADDYSLVIRIGKDEYTVKVPPPPIPDKVNFVLRDKPFELRLGWQSRLKN